MNTELKNLLLSFDSEEDCEAPSGFDYLEEIGKVEQIKSIIESALNIKLEIDKCVQDASFFTDLYLLEESERVKRDNSESHVLIYDFAIRFSSFGKMVTIFNNHEVDIIKRYPVNEIIEILQEQGYIYIQSNFLDELYDGINKYIGKNDTWWIRFFDYL